MLIYSVILFAVALLFLFIGISIYKGNARLIHDYHQTKVSENDKSEYCKGIGKGMFACAAAMFASGAAALLGSRGTVVAVSLCILFAGLIVSLIIIVKVQKKYNGGIF
ncbi:MAG: DUF3784 domain-containing protein [Oscillospiraceae bacterium]|nr:DUF3784 domain-containing protein [Oscillospiraceae bacterium]